MITHQLTCHQVSMQYGNHVALENVSFRVEAGDYLCIVGENGSGKSTLLKGILGLLPLKSGTVRFADGVRAGEIGYLPQQTAVQKDFPASVLEVVLSGCLSQTGWRPFMSKREKDVACDNMHALGIDALADQSYRNLSGGQQQRVLLARALCATRRMLFLDEPLTGLDPGAASDFYELLRRLNRERGLTVVMTSHDIRAALQYAGKILHLETDVLFFGTAGEYVHSAAGSRFLGGGHGRA